MEGLQSKIIKLINRHGLLVSLLLVGFYILAQFVILSSIGTKGNDISHIRTEQEQLRLENEVLQAEIDKAKTSAQLEQSLDEMGLTYLGVEDVYALPTLAGNR